ncbi:hypothetical protein Tco_1323179 [Tanacetum coccineum]
MSAKERDQLRGCRKWLHEHCPPYFYQMLEIRHVWLRVTRKTLSHTLITKKHEMNHRVEVLQKSFEELKEARARDKELFEEAKEENRKQYEEKLKSQALTMKEEMVKEANAKIAEMFAQYTQQLPIPPS